MLKISTDIFSASVKKPHNTPLPPPIATVLAKRFIRSRTNQGILTNESCCFSRLYPIRFRREEPYRVGAFSGFGGSSCVMGTPEPVIETSLAQYRVIARYQ